MNFVTDSYSFASGDGRVILRACIDRPSKTAHSAFEFLNLYSCSIYDFVSDGLFLKVLNAYKISVHEGIRFIPLFYSLKCFVTYSDDIYLSCVMVAKLTRDINIISQSVDSAVFVKDKILPPEFLHRLYRNKKLAIDSEGFPCLAELADGKMVLRRVGKKNIIK